MTTAANLFFIVHGIMIGMLLAWALFTIKDNYTSRIKPLIRIKLLGISK